jgi:branched-subunit amino acid transport protein
MTALVIVLTASVATWLLRIGFIAVIPAERLPARVHRAFDDVAPAVLAAIVVTHVVRAGGPGELPWETLAAVLAAAVVAWHSRNLALPVVVGVAVFGLLLAAPDLRMEATAIPVGSIPQHRLAGAAAHVGTDEPNARADTVRWAEAAQARIVQETLAARAGVAEWSRFLAPDVTVDDRAWSGSRYQGRAAWREHLIGVYRLTLDEVHFQQVLLDPDGALVQQRLDHLAASAAPHTWCSCASTAPTASSTCGPRSRSGTCSGDRAPATRTGSTASRSSPAATSRRGPAAGPTTWRTSTRPGRSCRTGSPASRSAAVGPSATR